MLLTVRRLLLSFAILCACGDNTTPPVVHDAAPPDDAAVVVHDARIPVDAPARGVPCGDDFCDPDETQGCCVAPSGDAGCSPLDGLCLDDLVSCDGREDCLGDVCCDFGQGPACSNMFDCVEQQGGTPVCHGDVDCIPVTPHCCDHRCSATEC
jgi:hypothetical protein